jgi:hypothetical protein
MSKTGVDPLLVRLRLAILRVFEPDIDALITRRIVAYHQGLRDDGLIGPFKRSWRSSEDRKLLSNLEPQLVDSRSQNVDQGEGRAA